MKLQLFFTFLLLRLLAYSQDTTLYDSKWVEIKQPESAAYYKVVTPDKSDSDKVNVKYYYVNNNQIKYEVDYSSYKNGVREGRERFWYPNGQLKAVAEYSKGNLNGNIEGYYESGKIKRQDLYKEGDLVEGRCFALGGQKVQHTSFTIMPEFSGGMDKLIQFLATQLKYPKRQRDKRVEGDVKIDFFILEDGTVANIRVIESPNEDFSKEAIRIVKKMPKWTAGVIEDKVEPFELTLPIQFRIQEY